MTVLFSTRAPNADYLGFEASPEAILTAARKAEEVGFDSIFVNDHIVVGNDLAADLQVTGRRPAYMPSRSIFTNRNLDQLLQSKWNIS